MKKLLPLLFMTISPSLFATSFFSGESGATAAFVNKNSRAFDPAIFIDGYFAGQITLSNAFSLRGEFSLRTPDMYDKGFTKEAEDSIFQINELSATVTKSFAGATHTLSGFTGHFESAGSQQYIMRHLGTEKFSSILTENYEGQPQMNGDFHLAAAFRYMNLDFVGGVAAPLSTIDANGDKVFLLIDTLYYHMGLDLLLGNKAMPFSLFAQYGFEYLPIKSPETAKSLVPSEIYLLIEPRFDFGKTKLHLTAYSMPKESVSKMVRLDDTMGASISIFSDRLHTGKRNYTAGFNTTVSFEDKYFNDLEDKNLLDKLNVKLMPFAEIDVNEGKLSLLLQVGVRKLIDDKPNAVKINIGYKKEL